MAEWLHANTPLPEEAHRLAAAFQEGTSERGLNDATCAVCATTQPERFVTSILPSAAPWLSLMRTPPDFLPTLKRHHPNEWRDLFQHRPTGLDCHVLEPSGLTETHIGVCTSCTHDLNKGKVPSNSLIAGTWTGPVPQALKDLSEAEQMVLGIHRTIQAIFFLKGAGSDPESRQRASKGHWLAYPQYMTALAQPVMSVPRPPETLAESLQVNLVGPPPHGSISNIVQVRPAYLYKARKWLSERNHLYEGIAWCDATASRYDTENNPIAVTHTTRSDDDEGERPSYIPPLYDSESDTDDEVEDTTPERSGVTDSNGLSNDSTTTRLSALRALLPSKYVVSKRADKC